MYTTCWHYRNDSEVRRALLGKHDEPTDAVEKYCGDLGDELTAHDFDSQLAPVT